MVANFIRFGGDILLGSAILVIGFWLANLAHDAIDRASGAGTQGLARIGRYAILALVIAMGLRAMGIADDIVTSPLVSHSAPWRWRWPCRSAWVAGSGRQADGPLALQVPPRGPPQ